MDANSKKYKVLRIYLSNTDKIKQTSAYESIAFKAKAFGLAGATVYKGIMGYGASSELNPVKFWELTEKVPVIVEMVDEESKIMSFIESIRPWLDLMSKGCLITCHDTDVLLIRKGQDKQPKGGM